MAIQYLEGSATITVTEYSMPAAATYAAGSPQTTAGQVQVMIDLANLAAGDEYRIRFYEKARTADTQRLIDEARVEGAQGKPLWIGPALTLSRGWDITIAKIAGVDRAISWSVRRWPDA